MPSDPASLLCAGRSWRLAPLSVTLTAVKICLPCCVKKSAQLWTAHVNWGGDGMWASFYMPIFLIFSCTLLLTQEMEILLLHCLPERWVLFWRSEGKNLIWWRGETRHNRDQLGQSAEPLLQAKVPVSGGTGVGGMALSALRSGRWQ